MLQHTATPATHYTITRTWPRGAVSAVSLVLQLTHKNFPWSVCQRQIRCSVDLYFLTMVFTETL